VFGVDALSPSVAVPGVQPALPAPSDLLDLPARAATATATAGTATPTGSRASTDWPPDLVAVVDEGIALATKMTAEPNAEGGSWSSSQRTAAASGRTA